MFISSLLPCPFCGGPARVLEEDDDRRPPGSVFTLGCGTPACPGELVYWREPVRDLPAAVSRWNTRIPSAVADADPDGGVPAAAVFGRLLAEAGEP